MLTLCSNVPAVAQAYITPALMTTGSNDLTAVDGGDVCPRCSKQVFIAEKRQAAGKVVNHSMCVVLYSLICLLLPHSFPPQYLTFRAGRLLHMASADVSSAQCNQRAQ